MNDLKYFKISPLLIVLFFVLLNLFPRTLFTLVILGVGWYFLIKGLPQILNKNQARVIDLDSPLEKLKNLNINNFIQNMQKKISLIAILIIIAVIIINSFVVIPAGYTGVYHVFGKVNDNELPSGLHFINPLARVEKMSARTEEYTMSVAKSEGKKFGDDSIDALTKEGLKVGLDITVLYHLQLDKASDIFKELGVGYEEKLIRPQIRSAIREVIAQYEAKDIYSEKRQEAGKQILEKLKEKIEDRGIMVEEVLMRNVQLPTKLEVSIQEKLTAEQETERYSFLLDKEKKEKERKIIEAEGQRDAQKIINESLSSQYLQYLYIQGLKDREGTIYVPTDPNNGLPVFKGL